MESKETRQTFDRNYLSQMQFAKPYHHDAHPLDSQCLQQKKKAVKISVSFPDSYQTFHLAYYIGCASPTPHREYMPHAATFDTIQQVPL